MEQRITIEISVHLGDIDISAGPASLTIVDDGPAEIEVPVKLGALGWLNLRFGG